MKQFKKYLILTDKNLNIAECSPDFLDYLGMTKLQNMDQVVPPQDLMLFRNALFAVNYGNIGLCCFRIRTKNGCLNWIAANMEKPESDQDSIKIELSDIQSLKEDSFLAHYDKMTGLFNKQTIIEYAQNLTMNGQEKSFYLFLLDIDHFKAVNDTFGHMRGDEVISEVASIIQKCVGDNGFVGRIGGDEFMLVLEKINTEMEVREVLRLIRDSVKARYENMGEGVSVTVSMGGGLFPEYAQDYDSLFKMADKMLYIAKVKGRDRYIIYTPSVHGAITDSGMVKATHFAADDAAKTKFVLDVMDDLWTGRKIDKKQVLEKTLDLFDLDSIYVVEDPDRESVIGVVREGNETTISIPVLGCEMVEALLNKNTMAIINIFDLKKDTSGQIKPYMEQHKYRMIAVYKSTAQEQTCYYVFINNMESNCRLSDTDISDLVYLSYLLEHAE